MRAACPWPRSAVIVSQRSSSSAAVTARAEVLRPRDIRPPVAIAQDGRRTARVRCCTWGRVARERRQSCGSDRRSSQMLPRPAFRRHGLKREHHRSRTRGAGPRAARCTRRPRGRIGVRVGRAGSSGGTSRGSSHRTCGSPRASWLLCIRGSRSRGDRVAGGRSETLRTASRRRTGRTPCAPAVRLLGRRDARAHAHACNASADP